MEGARVASSSILSQQLSQASPSPSSILTPPRKRATIRVPNEITPPDCRSSNPGCGDSSLTGDQRYRKAHYFHVYDRPAASPPPPTTEKTQNKEKYDCVIVGAGISGLCTAQALATKHAGDVNKVLVTEAGDRVGGIISTVQKGDYLLEEGPCSFQPSDPMLTMVVDSGLKDELILGDPAAPRFVFWEGNLRPVPAGPADLPFFDLLSFQGKLRAGLGALGLRAAPPACEESVEEFVRRNLGAEVFERLIEPFCLGVYAGNPAKLSMKAAFERVWRLEETGGSIIGGTFKSIQEKRKIPFSPRDP